MFPDECDPETFRRCFEELLAGAFFAWVMEAPTARGQIPVGMVIGQNFVYGSVVLGCWNWFPWASKRNIYESTVELLNGLRSHTPVVFHAELADKAFANRIAQHGVIRRVGTLYDMADGPVAEYQTRQPKRR